MNYMIYDTKIGKLIIKENNGFITEIGFSRYGADNENKETETIKKAYVELTEYLEGKRTHFTVKLNPKGTEFQKKVWNELIKIPYGQTRSYKEIAESVGSPKGYRAVGMANHNNPIMIIIPCHRVINANGALGGYGGGIDKKIKLLEIEGYKHVF